MTGFKPRVLCTWPLGSFLNKWPIPASFFIFVLFHHKFYRKAVSFSGIRTWIVGVEVDHVDQLTTTTAQPFGSFQTVSCT